MERNIDNKMTVWEAFMEFVNSKEYGSVITRQEIIQYINRETGMYPYGGTTSDIKGHWDNDKFVVKHYSVNTLDYMRNLAEKVGYLDKTRCAGMYVVNKHFPSGYTVSQLRKDYDKL